MRWFYSDHDTSGQRKRVWRADWPGDVFEVVDLTTFDILVRLLGTQLEEYFE